MKNIFPRIIKLIKNIFIIYILFINISYCYLIIPLQFNPVFKINDTNPSSIMRRIVHTKAYAIIELGIPRQSIQIPLDFESNDFYISENARYEFSKVPDYFDNLKFFNSSISSSCEKAEEKLYDGDNFDYSDYYKDIFYFNEKNVTLEFYLPFILKLPETGGIGLQLWPKSKETTSTIDEKRTFFKKLKNNNLIDDYFWSVFYNSKNHSKDEGFLLLGSLPHKLNIDLGYYKKEYFNQKYMNNINAKVWVDIIKNRFKFDEIYAFNGNDKNKKISEINFHNNATILFNVELDYHFGGIQVSNSFQPYFEKYFEEYISRKECFFDYFIINTRKKYFFYCKNDNNILTRIKKNFPGFNFKSQELNFNFELVADDLFVQEKNYTYCLMLIDSFPGDIWIMGRPFLQKYQFIFNPDTKYITFYSNLDEINKEKSRITNEVFDGNNKYIIFIIIIIIFFIIILVLSLFLWKYYFQSKNLQKKRANELDDDYDYIQKKDKVYDHKENLGILNE